MTNLKLQREDYQYLTGETGDVVKLELTYSRDSRVRGIYLDMRSVKIEHSAYGTSTSCMLFSPEAVHMLVAPLPRKNPKVLAALAAKLDPVAPAVCALLLTDKGAAVLMATEALA